MQKNGASKSLSSSIKSFIPLRQRRELLEREKERVEKDLNVVKTGDVEAIKRLGSKVSVFAPKVDGQLSVMDPESKQKLAQDQARIEQIKESIRQTNAELLPEFSAMDNASEMYKGKDIARMTSDYVGSIIEKNKDNPKKLINELSAVRSHLDQDVRPSGPTPNPLKDRDLRTPPAGGLNQIPGYNRQDSKKASVINISARPKPKQPARASQLPVPQPENMEPVSHFPQPYAQGAQSQIYPYPQMQMPMPNWASMYPAPPAPPDPLLLQNLSEIKEKIGKAMEKNQSLESELKKLKEESTPGEAKPGTASKASVMKKEINLPQPAGIFRILLTR